MYHWRDTRFHLLDGRTDVYLREKMPQLDEPCGDISEGDESIRAGIITQDEKAKDLVSVFGSN